MKSKHLKEITFCLCFTVILSFLFGFTDRPSNTGLHEAEPTVEQVILSGLERHQAMIDLTEYHQYPAEITGIYRKLLESEPQLFFIFPTVSYTYDSDGYLLYLIPQYRIDEAQTMVCRQTMLQALKDIQNLAPQNGSEADKAHFIHDYLASSYTYSETGEENYDAYSLLTEGHGVCQAFSLLYIAISRCLGLEADMVTSPSMDHAWNHVKINDNYYHVDVTRDLTQDGESISHERFLLCDQAIKYLGYTDYSCHGTHICDAHGLEGSRQEGVHDGFFVMITGSCLYIDSCWLALQTDGSPLSFRFSPQADGTIILRVSDPADITGDGKLSLSDLLNPTLQAAQELAEPIKDAMRQHLMEQTLKVALNG